MKILNLLERGPIEYLEGDKIQRDLHQRIVKGQAENTLILAEFQPTYTAGRATKDADILNTNLPVIRVDRAGSVTWHGPGQLVVYPIVKLTPPADLIKYIRAVEKAIVDTGRIHYNLDLTTIKGRAGAWLLNPDRKLCAIGLKVAQNVSLHGLAFNINPDFNTAFTGIIPCGLADAGVSSLQAEGVHTTPQELGKHLVYHLKEQLQPLITGAASTENTPALPPQENQIQADKGQADKGQENHVNP